MTEAEPEITTRAMGAFVYMTYDGPKSDKWIANTKEEYPPEGYGTHVVSIHDSKRGQKVLIKRARHCD